MPQRLFRNADARKKNGVSIQALTNYFSVQKPSSIIESEKSEEKPPTMPSLLDWSSNSQEHQLLNSILQYMTGPVFGLLDSPRVRLVLLVAYKSASMEHWKSPQEIMQATVKLAWAELRRPAELQEIQHQLSVRGIHPRLEDIERIYNKYRFVLRPVDATVNDIVEQVTDNNNIEEAYTILTYNAKQYNFIIPGRNTILPIIREKYYAVKQTYTDNLAHRTAVEVELARSQWSNQK